MKDKLQKISEVIEGLRKHYIERDDFDNGWNFALDKVLSLLDTFEEEPKECMYSKDNYTDEDRKALCDGCEENCEYNKKGTVNDKLGGINNALVQDRLITSKPIGVPADAIELVSIPDKKEPVSEDLSEAASVYQTFHRYATPFKAYIDGAQWQQQQFEKNRLKHCDSITNEQAELEQKFLDQHLDKHQCMPTFLDAIEYGMRLKEKEMQSTIELAEDHAMLAGMEKMKEDFGKQLIDAWEQGEKPIEKLASELERKITNFAVSETINHIKKL